MSVPVPPRSFAELLIVLKASPEAEARIHALRERLYGHVFRTVDLDALFALEQMVDSLVYRAGVDDHELGLASALIADALTRVAQDPARCVRMEPHGITDLEIVATEYDETCELCQHDLAEAKRMAAGANDRFEAWADDELLAMNAEAATKWRREHAVALRRFGLA